MSEKRILLVTHDQGLRSTRLALLRGHGFEVEYAVSDDDAMVRLQKEHFDLILIGRDAQLSEMPLDERLARSGNRTPILKIDSHDSDFARVVEALPGVWLEEVRTQLDRPLRYYVLASTKGFRVMEMMDLELVRSGLQKLLIDPPYETREAAEAARLRLLGKPGD